MTQREMEDLILKVDEAFDNGSGDRIGLPNGGNRCGPALAPSGEAGSFLRRDVMEAAEKIKAERRASLGVMGFLLHDGHLGGICNLAQGQTPPVLRLPLKFANQRRVVAARSSGDEKRGVHLELV